MRISSIYLVLLTSGVCGVAAQEVLHTASVNSDGGDRILAPQSNRGGWVNPEDLTPMPQCIAQQDQSTWLSTMTKCTSKRCTRHFGVICTYHQWLTQLSCLSTGFSSDVIKGYLPYCGRSILAKTQLYLWVRGITGRTWLVDVGDANGLQNLSPASLSEGYAAVNTIYKAPACLTGSVSALSMEPFRNVMTSCSFTSTTQHTGNAARPWEYRESLRSMIALDYETVGYDLTQRSIGYGDYFDKECFCSTFTIDLKKEPCSGQIDLTRERLWIYATCGPTSLPDNWTDMLKTTEFAYIPIEDWHWPKCVTDMPKQVTELAGLCATDACELDSSGYCIVKRAIDRACFCRDISYDSCRGSCQIFETRIGYVKWLHDLCGNVQDWHGLPDNWRQLAAPIALDMIPWQWTIKPSNDSIKATEKCPSNDWKLGSFTLVNMATFPAAYLIHRTGIHRIARGFLWDSHPPGWIFPGILIVFLQLFANWFNAFLVQNTFGYEDVPIIQLMLLWCSMPRLTWLPILLSGVHPFEAMSFSAAASSLFAEMILQLLSSYYMIQTISYGQEHNFYIGGTESAESGGPARFMYAGALMWLIIISLVFVWFSLVFVWLMLAMRGMDGSTRSDSPDLPKWRRSNQTTSLASGGGNYTGYGTLPVKRQNDQVSQKSFVGLYAVASISMLLWIAQWLFWGGFIDLSSEEFCPPKLGVLTAVWITFSSAGAIIGATL